MSVRQNVAAMAERRNKEATATADRLGDAMLAAQQALRAQQQRAAATAAALAQASASASASASSTAAVGSASSSASSSDAAGSTSSSAALTVGTSSATATGVALAVPEGTSAGTGADAEFKTAVPTSRNGNSLSSAASPETTTGAPSASPTPLDNGSGSASAAGPSGSPLDMSEDNMPAPAPVSSWKAEWKAQEAKSKQRGGGGARGGLGGGRLGKGQQRAPIKPENVMPRPLRFWNELGGLVPEQLYANIEKAGYKDPTPYVPPLAFPCVALPCCACWYGAVCPVCAVSDHSFRFVSFRFVSFRCCLRRIQRAAIPVGLQPQQWDVVGIAETGSGKTCAFLVPLLAYLARLPPLNTPERIADGPYALIMVCHVPIPAPPSPATSFVLFLCSSSLVLLFPPPPPILSGPDS
jgi:hypothetical protein